MRKLIATLLLIAGTASMPAHAVPVDIAFIVDQSFSMRVEFGWIGNAIVDIDAALADEDAVTSVRYGIVGFMENPQTRDNGTELLYQDFTSDVTTIQGLVDPRPTLYGTRESGYEAAYWSQTGFSWNDDAAKVMILLMDEAADQNSALGADAPAFGNNNNNNAARIAREIWLGEELDENGFLLNVITTDGLMQQWDQAVFDINEAYEGLFSLNDLRDDPDAFTQTFVDAKIGEIVDNLPPDPCLTDPTLPQCNGNGVPVSEPATLGLLAMGLFGLAWMGRRTRRRV